MLLFVTLVRRGHWEWEAALFSRVLRLVAATVVMAIALHYASGYLANWLTPEARLITQLTALMLLIGMAMIIYFALAFAIGGADASMLRRNLKRKPRPDTAKEEADTSVLPPPQI